MALITNYATLQAAIAEYLGRSDLTDAIKTFIQLAEADIRRNVRDRTVTEAFTITATASQVLDATIGDVMLLRFNTDTRKYPLIKTSMANLATLRRSGSGVPPWSSTQRVWAFSSPSRTAT